jgi:hypothetical protein
LNSLNEASSITALTSSSNKGRQDVDVGRRGVAEARADADEVARHVFEQDRALVGRGLADQTFTQNELAPQRVVALGAVAGDELELGVIVPRAW